MVNLRYLELEENLLREIPEEICSLPKILYISLFENPLENLPNCLDQLRNNGCSVVLD